MAEILTRRRFAVDDYHRMAQAGVLGDDDRVELIDGEIVMMAPIGARHAATVRVLTRLWVSRLGDRAIVSVQDPVQLDAYSERVKMPRYARAGIGEAWLIDLDACRVEVYREPSPDGYRDLPDQ